MNIKIRQVSSRSLSDWRSSMLDIKINDDGVVGLKGRFDASQAEKAESVFKTIDENCVIDMKELEYISSAGLGILIATYQRLDKSGKNFRLTGVSEHVRNVFHYSGLDKVFDIE